MKDLIVEVARHLPPPGGHGRLRVVEHKGKNGVLVEIICDTYTSLSRFGHIHTVPGYQFIDQSSLAAMRSPKQVVECVRKAIGYAYDVARDRVHDLGLRIINLKDAIVRPEEYEMLPGYGI